MGCDNRIAYIFYDNGYNVINNTTNIKTYHLHNTQIRDYNGKDTIYTKINKDKGYLFIDNV